MERLAIRIHTLAEAQEAVKYFESLGYKSHVDFNYSFSPGIIKYIVTNYVDAYAGDSKYREWCIGTSLGSYAEKECHILNLVNKEKEKEMVKFQVGDVVRLTDWSGSVSLTENKLCQKGMRHSDVKGSKYEVIEGYEQYVFPTALDVLTRGPRPADKQNNIALRITECSDNTRVGEIVFTNTRFCELIEEPIKVNGYTVDFRTDGSINIGGWQISSDVMDKIIEKRTQVWDNIPF